MREMCVGVLVVVMVYLTIGSVIAIGNLRRELNCDRDFTLLLFPTYDCHGLQAEEPAR